MLPEPRDESAGQSRADQAADAGRIVTGTEWAAYYDELAATFGLTIDVTGPHFGTEPLLDVIADSPALASFVGEQTRLVWPADYGLWRIALHDPAPVYPHSLIWRRDNPHLALTTLRNHLGSTQPDREAWTWTPTWVEHSTHPHQPSGNNVTNRNVAGLS